MARRTRSQDVKTNGRTIAKVGKPDPPNKPSRKRQRKNPASSSSDSSSSSVGVVANRQLDSVLRDSLVRVRDAVERYSADESDPIAYGDAVQAVRNLRLAVEKPEEFIVRIRYAGHQVTAINMLNELGVIEALAADDGKEVSAAELSEKTGGDELLIVRLMRLLTAVGCCDEAGPQTYRANRRTTELAKPGSIASFRYIAGVEWPCATHIRNYMRSTHFHRDSSAAGKSSFEFTYGQSFWQHLNENEDQKSNFDTQMKSGRRAAPQQVWFQRYPLDSRLGEVELKDGPDAVLFVDVGGGRGAQAGAFREEFPHLPGRCVVQETKETIETNQEKPPGVEMMEYDFFTPQPIKGARFYLFRSICHDWTTDICRKLLRNTVEAMDPGYSRLLIDEWVLPETNASEKGVCLDISMMLNFNAMERTREQWRNLLEDVGLEIVEVHGADPNAESIVEAKMKT